jgi:predicted DsbA family dithiol-disulfide isomerase
VRVEIWSDFVCPWCYVGKRRFERALAARPNADRVEIVHRAYLLYSALERGASVDRRSMLMAKYRLTGEQADAMNASMVRTAAAEGLDYHLKGGLTGNTFDAHQLAGLARDRGCQDAVVERLYHAFFVEQRSIFERNTIVALGVEAGLDADDISHSLHADAYAAAVEADVAEARAIGVTGVPFFVFDGRHAVAGAQAVEVFEQVLGGTNASERRA